MGWLCADSHPGGVRPFQYSRNTFADAPQILIFFQPEPKAGQASQLASSLCLQPANSAGAARFPQILRILRHGPREFRGCHPVEKRDRIMSTSRQTIFGTLSIVALVVAARWFAGDPDLHWPLAPFRSAARPCPPDTTVTRLDWSADGRSLLCHVRGLGEGVASLIVHAVAPGGRRMPIYVSNQPIVKAALAPDGGHVLLATAAGELQWMETESFETVTLVRLPKEMDFTEVTVFDNTLVAAVSRGGTVYLADPGARTVGELAIDRTRSVCSLQFSSDGMRLMTGSAGGSIEAWDLVSRTRLQSFEGHAPQPTIARFLPDGKRVISAGLDDTIRIWEIAGGREQWCFESRLRGVRALDVAPDGKTAAWAGLDSVVVVWDLEQRRKKFEFITKAPFLTTVKFSPDGGALAAAGGESLIRIYDMRTGAGQTLPVSATVERTTQ
jgi:hypothetical protein